MTEIFVKEPDTTTPRAVDSMRLYLAPLEGVTGWQYRRLVAKHFGSVDRYFTPFITPAQRIGESSRFGREIEPGHNEGLETVPQILTNDAEGFLETANALRDLGYEEVNLNLGCPSGTVVKKGRGSGFLQDPWGLDRFLEKIFSEAQVKVSIKTRIGYADPEEFADILEIYNRYPYSELIVHPRVRMEMYQGEPHLAQYEEAYQVLDEGAANGRKLVYNGNLFTDSDAIAMAERYPKTSALMLGRGAIARPDIFRAIRTGKEASCEELAAFHKELYQIYLAALGRKDVLFKMKEIWSFMKTAYPDSDWVWNKIRRSKTNEEFLANAAEILATERA